MKLSILFCFVCSTFLIESVSSDSIDFSYLISYYVLNMHNHRTNIMHSVLSYSNLFSICYLRLQDQIWSVFFWVQIWSVGSKIHVTCISEFTRDEHNCFKIHHKIFQFYKILASTKLMNSISYQITITSWWI